MSPAPTSPAPHQGPSRWRERLAAFPPALELPTLRSDGARREPRFESQPLDLSRSALATLSASFAQGEASDADVLLTLFLVFLRRTSGQTDLVVGLGGPGGAQRAARAIVKLL